MAKKRDGTEYTSMIVEGYVRCNYIHYIPNIIIYWISLFYSDITVKIYDNKGKYISNNINNITNIYINYKSYFLVTNDKRIYVYGNNGYSQLGIPSNKISFTDKPIINEFFENISLKANIITHNMTNDHCFVYSQDNALFGFGRNESLMIGTHGTSDSENIETPTLIPCDSTLKAIKCGEYHSLFLTHTGKLFGCGDNDCNQLLHSGTGVYSINIPHLILLMISLLYFQFNLFGKYVGSA